MSQKIKIFFFHLHTTWWPKTCWFFCLHQITICLLTPRKVVKKWKNTHLFKALHTSKNTILNKVSNNKCKGWILNMLERQKLNHTINSLFKVSICIFHFSAVSAMKLVNETLQNIPQITFRYIMRCKSNFFCSITVCRLVSQNCTVFFHFLLFCFTESLFWFWKLSASEPLCSVPWLQKLGQITYHFWTL